MLRGYQQRGKDRLRAEFKAGNRRVLFVSPTGSGKTVQAVDLLHDVVDNGRRGLFVCDRDILVSQTANTLGYNNLDYGVIKAGYDEARTEPLQVASIQSLVNRDLPPADVIMFDEAHERLDQQLWIAKRYPKALLIGLTATPWRADGRSFASVYQSLVVNTTPKELIDLGYLVPERVFAPARIDTSGVRVSYSTGDYVQDDLAKAVGDMKIIGDAVESWKKYAEDKMTICFCVNVAHAKKVCKKFNDQGVPAEVVTGEVGEDEREAVLDRLRSGKTKVLVNVEVYVKGADIPAIECVVDLAPTLSLSRYIQKIGRAARPNEGKEYFLQLDHAGNSLRHGFWSDDREYSLGKPKKESESEYIASTKMCPECFYVMRSTQMQCEVCDYVFPQTPENLPSHVDGELVEVINEDVNVIVEGNEVIYDSPAEGTGKFHFKGHENYWQGEHTIERENDHYNLYGKRITGKSFKDSLLWLANKQTGSKSRRYLISKILEGKRKGHKPQWAFMQYKRKYKFWPKME